MARLKGSTRAIAEALGKSLEHLHITTPCDKLATRIKSLDDVAKRH